MKSHLSIFFGILKQALAYLLVPAFLYLVIYLVYSIIGLGKIGEQESSLLADILTLISVILFFGLYKKEQLSILFHEQLQIKRLLLLFPLSIVTRIPLLLFVILIAVFLGDSFLNTINEGVEYQWQGFTEATGAGYYIGLISFGIIGPIQEELFFRGVVFNYLKKFYSVKASILYVTIVFTLFHFHPGLFPSSFILGFFLVYVYQKWNNLAYSIILHMFINLHPFLIDFIGSKF